MPNLYQVVTALTADGSPDLNADYVMTVDSGASTLKKVLLTNLSGATNVSGWFTPSGTWSYSSADAPTFVISVNADMTATISVGMRIKLTQTTEKYFIVTAVGAFSGGATLITVYGGTDYTLANAAITSPQFSPHKTPFGFPASPLKWTVELVDTSDRTQATPSAGTFYNLGSLSLSVPIGVWDLSYSAFIIITDSSLAYAYGYSALSTANNSVSDVQLYAGFGFEKQAAAGIQSRQTIKQNRIVALTSKTTYYTIASVGVANTDSFGFYGTAIPTIIRAVCAYL